MKLTVVLILVELIVEFVVENFKKWMNVLLLVTTTLFISDLALCAHNQDLMPILPLSYGMGKLPLFNDAMRDPAFAARMIGDDLAAEQIAADIKNQKTQLPLAKGKTSKGVYNKLYESYVILSYHLEDLRDGSKASFEEKADQLGTLSEAYKGVVTYGKSAAAVEKNAKLKSRILYHVIIAQYAIDHDARNSARLFSKIRQNLTAPLQARVDYFIAASAGAKDKRSVAILARSSSYLSATGKISADLLMARIYATYHSQQYRNHLAAAADKAGKLSDAQKTEVLGYAIGAWRAAESSSRNWGKAPFSLKSFEGSEQIRAISERSALKDVRDGHYSVAAKKYRVLAKVYNGTNYMFKLDERVVALARMDAAKVTNISAYTSVLVEMQLKYKDTQAFGANFKDQAAAASASYKEAHRRTIAMLTDNALKAKANKTLRGVAVTLATEYAQNYAAANEKRTIMVKVAKIEQLSGDYAKAVAIYADLISTSQDNNEKSSLLVLAIDSQTRLAKWPLTAPWFGGVKKGSDQERRKLLDFYIAYNSLHSDKVAWPVIAQIGLLEINLSEGGEAFKLWTDALNKDTSTVHAERAAGLMLISYRKYEKWDELESMARLCMKSSLAALAGNRKLAARDYLGDALFFGGKKAYDAQDYKKSTQKLAEFVRDYRNDHRRDEGLFVLAYAYRGNNEHAASINTLRALVEEHPSSAFMKKTLLTGGEWSMQLSLEDFTMYFYEHFMIRFAGDTEIGDVRAALIDLYTARKDYGKIAAIYRGMVIYPKNDVTTRVAAAIMYQDLEYHYGDLENALWASAQIMKLASGNSLALAKVYGLEARIARDHGEADLRKLKTLESKLSALDLSDSEIVESLASIKFMIAKVGAEQTREEVFNLGLENPMKSLEDYYAMFFTIKQNFDAVCSVGKSSYCAPAMHEVAVMTKNTIKTLEEIKMPETLESSIVIKFGERKQAMMGTLADISLKADRQAVVLVSEGTTTPENADGITFSNSEDWSMDSVANESKTAFVQWVPAKK